MCFEEPIKVDQEYTEKILGHALRRVARIGGLCELVLRFAVRRKLAKTTRLASI